MLHLLSRRLLHQHLLHFPLLGLAVKTNGMSESQQKLTLALLYYPCFYEPSFSSNLRSAHVKVTTLSLKKLPFEKT